jgi:hypothetical protein
MNLPIPSAPPVVKSALGAVGNEWGKFTSGIKTAGQKLENFGARIRTNEIQGQKDLRSGKLPSYGAINPFKK